MNHGRWVADCPEDSCGFAALADPASKLKCPDHGLAEIVWPENFREIDRLLAARPHDPILGAKHANWRPGETVESLRAENVEHGVSD
jgi:hypothetical protein